MWYSQLALRHIPFPVTGYEDLLSQTYPWKGSHSLYQSLIPSILYSPVVTRMCTVISYLQGSSQQELPDISSFVVSSLLRILLRACRIQRGLQHYCTGHQPPHRAAACSPVLRPASSYCPVPWCHGFSSLADSHVSWRNSFDCYR